jgi:aspartate carbamoyltransferase catalytic subunit
MKHIISSDEFNKQDIQKILDLAEQMEQNILKKTVPQTLQGKIVACLFYEPSTRTRLSFETAVLRLGGSVIGMENALVSSSAVKGETIEDTTLIINGFADLIVMRHPKEGSAEQASKVSQIPVVNAGDGGNQHPTQALLDLYTIKKEKQRLNNLNVVMVGDLLYGRTIHSTLSMLSWFEGINFTFVAPQRLGLPEKYKNLLTERGIKFEETENLKECLGKADVLYMTRVQKERFASAEEYENLKDAYILNSETLKYLKSDATILHALPRVNEIAREVDLDPRAAYFRQARNGVFVRMAILEQLLS